MICGQEKKKRFFIVLLLKKRTVIVLHGLAQAENNFQFFSYYLLKFWAISLLYFDTGLLCIDKARVILLVLTVKRIIDKFN